MKRQFFSLLVLVGIVLASGRASAQVLGRSGDAVFGAERLFGVRGEHARYEYPAPAAEGRVDATTISLGIADAVLPVNIPRLSFDYLVARKFSVGGAIGYSSNDFDGLNPGGPIGVGGKTKTFLFLGRVGFLHMFGRVLGIWPRGGLVYHSRDVNGFGDESAFGLNAECMFPIVVAPHFGFLTGISFDQSLSGNVDPDPGPAPDYDFNYRSIALQFGLFGWL